MTKLSLMIELLVIQFITRFLVSTFFDFPECSPNAHHFFEN